jgi:DNA-binding NarL/FixJ family response regulator
MAAAQGFAVLPRALAAGLLSARAGRPRGALDEPSEPLTPREREVLELLAQGLSNRRIAERLASATTPRSSTWPPSSASWGRPAGPRR